MMESDEKHTQEIENLGRPFAARDVERRCRGEMSFPPKTGRVLAIYRKDKETYHAKNGDCCLKTSTRSKLGSKRDLCSGVSGMF